MSANGEEMDVLLNAVRDRIKAALSLTDKEVDVCPDGQPNPASGQIFVAVYGASVSNSQQNCLDERYSFRVTVTARMGHAPRDRKRNGPAWQLALRVRGVLHMSYEVRTLALAANANVDFVEPPCFLSARQEPPKGPDWFWAEPTGTGSDPTGMAVTLEFGKVRKVTYLGEEPG